MRVVVDLGGSVIFNREKRYDFPFLKRFASLIKRNAKKHEFLIVVGGGVIAKESIRDARNFIKREDKLDLIGIAFTRVNARVFSLLLGELAVPEIPESVEDAHKCYKKGKVLVCGGFHPGQTTDAVAASLAESFNANALIIATDVDGIYDKNPKKHVDAKLTVKMSKNECTKLAKKRHEAGSSLPLDPVAVKIISRSSFPVYVINGRNLKNVESVLEGKGFKGTLIS